MTEDTPVSLLDLAKSRRKPRGSRCTIARLLTTNADKADQILDLIANSGEGRGEEISYATSAEVISEATGTKIEGQTISRHLRGRCGCP